KSGDCATRSWACRAWYGRPDRRVLTLVERWLKKSALEMQEYVYLTCSAFYGVFTRPFYRHDIVEQFDQIGAGSMTVVLLDGLYIQDVWMGLSKPFVFGFVIVTIACHVGLRTIGGTAGVGKATTVSVVAGSVAVIASDFFVTQIFVALFY